MLYAPTEPGRGAKMNFDLPIFGCESMMDGNGVIQSTVTELITSPRSCGNVKSSVAVSRKDLGLFESNLFL
ncbi:MAG TPA: hypothetical protein DHW07_04510 [Gammaproteobacteria bacterium]|nr:hypothetical protein [Gammaproteobacteria bacterium]